MILIDLNPQTAALSLGIGLVFSLLCYLTTNLSPGGMIIYSGTMFPAWKGSAFIAALSGEALIRVTLNGDTAAPADQWKMGMRIRDIAQAPDGAIWLLEDGKGANGRLFRITPKG